jgi:tetratricopeptide (TPR) repeat protein
MPRDFSQPNPAPFRAQREFTDREEFQEAFWNRVSTLHPERQNVLYFYGVGGIGKSALLRELRRQLRDLPHMRRRPTPHKEAAWGFVDFQSPEHRHAPKAMLQLRESLAENSGVVLPTFDIAYAHYHLRSYHESQSKGLSDLAGRLSLDEVTSDTLTSVVEEIPGLSQVFKMGNLFSKAADARQKKLRLQQNRELKLFLFERDPLKMTDPLIDFFVADLRAAFNAERPLVLFLDTFEALKVASATEYAGARPDSWVERLAGALPGVLMVIAGRRALDWAKRDSDWEERDLLETHLVGDLAPEDAKQFLTTAGLPDHLIPTVLENFNGLPFYLDLVVDLYEQGVIKNDAEPTAEIFSGSIAQVVDRFLSYLSPAEQSAVRVLSAPGSFDYDRFKLLMDEFGTAYPQDRESYERLLQYSLFLTEGNTSHVHEVAREFLEGETQRAVREFIVSSIEEELSQTAVADFNVTLLTRLEEGFEQMQWLKGDLEAVEWLESHDSIFSKSGREGSLEELRGKAVVIRSKEFGEEHPDTIRSINNLANCLDSLGRFVEALAYLVRAFRQSQKILGEEHPDTISSLNNLASCLDSLGRSAEALPYHERTLEQRQRILGVKHPKTILSLNNLANCLDSLGRSSEALPFHERALKQSQEILGEEHPYTILSLNNLAHCLDSLGRSTEALPFHERALKQSQKILGEEHPDAISSLNNLASCLFNLGRSSEALPYYERALKQSRKILGEEHPDAISSLNNLASCLYSLGRSSEALPYFVRVFEQRQRILGEEHPDTILALNNLAYCLDGLGRSSEALPYYKRSLEQSQKVLGEEHPNTISSINNLASCLFNLGRSSEALPYYKRSLEQSQKVLGEEHPDTILSLNNLASCLDGLGRSSEALLYFARSLEQSQKILGEEHPGTILSLNNLAYGLDKFGRSAEALPYFARAFEQRQKILGEEHPHTILSLNNLAYCLGKLDLSRETLPHYETVLEQRRKILGQEHPETISALNNLALNFDELGRQSEALPYYERVHEQCQKVFGNDHPATIVSLKNRAICLEKLGRSEDALPYYERALEKARIVFGQNHPMTVTIQNNWELCRQKLA